MNKKKLEQLMTVDDLIELTRIPRSTLLLRVATGEIPSIKIGRHRRFLPEDILKWLKKQAS